MSPRTADRWLFRFPVVAFVGAVLVPGCGGGAANAKPLPTAGDAFGGVQCSAVRPQTEPDLMAWDPASRANLRQLSRRGIVAVRYSAQGCNVELEVLSNCIAKKKGAEYEYEAYSATERKMARSARELFAQLPIGAARLSASVREGNMLRTDYMLVGVEALPPAVNISAADLEGEDCERATHVVSKIYVGGFAMAAGTSEEIGGGASLFGVGAGVSSGSRRRMLAEEGVPKACSRAQQYSLPEDGCSVPLRIGLMEVEGAGAPVSPWPKGQLVRIPGARYSISGLPEDKTGRWTGPGRLSRPRAHVSTIAAFELEKTEVTVAAFKACVSAGRCTFSGTTVGATTGGSADCGDTDQDVCTTPQCNWDRAGRLLHPMDCVTWEQASEYCGAIGRRLPNEEEWEYAAVPGQRRRRVWGDAYWGLRWGGQNANGEDAETLTGPTLDRRRDVCANGGTCVVGTKPKDVSPFGIMDLAGNAAEWTSSADAEEQTRIYRGVLPEQCDVVSSLSEDGEMNCGERGLDPRVRNALDPADSRIGLGFRCAK